MGEENRIEKEIRENRETRRRGEEGRREEIGSSGGLRGGKREMGERER